MLNKLKGSPNTSRWYRNNTFGPIIIACFRCVVKDTRIHYTPTKVHNLLLGPNVFFSIIHICFKGKQMKKEMRIVLLYCLHIRPFAYLNTFFSNFCTACLEDL